MDFDTPYESSIGHQASSLRPSSAGFSFGRSSRSRLADAGKDSPGPVYLTPEAIGSAPTSVFGTASARAPNHYPYPPSSVDLLRSARSVDHADLKFPSARGTVFGTEMRGDVKNAEVLRNSPEAGYGKAGPGFVYNPNDKPARPKSAPVYTMRARTPIHQNRSSTPNRVAPNSYRSEVAIGVQHESKKKTAPRSTFSRSDRFGKSKESSGDVSMQTAPIISCFGNQKVSGFKSQPSAGFGSATRESRGKSGNHCSGKDGGPAGRMGPPRMPHPKTAPIKEQIRFGL
jgi:hypothetical protein